MKITETHANGSGNGHAVAAASKSIGSSAVNAHNLAFVEDLYFQWHADPTSVDPAWRGRGLGRALLTHALAQMRAAGLVGAALGVNGANSSATALYESVGMRIESRADRYAKRLAA